VTGRGALWIVVLLVAAAAPIWCYLGGPPLTESSDGRYATVSRDMAEHDHWLAPRLGADLHLTKPPLTYWTQAACIRVFGATDFAVRMPSAIAGTLLLAAVLAMGWQMGGWRVGVLSAAVLSVMPMHVVVSRLTLTDGLLQLWWFVTLAGSLMCVRRPAARRWPIVLWAAVAMGWLTKGPIALLPLVIVVAWLVIGRRWRELGRLRWGIGLPLSLAPVAIWFAAVVTQVPGAWERIVDELSTQAAGGTHGDNPWYYAFYFMGVFIVAMFPATAMLNIPPVNYSFRAAWRSLRDGRDVCLWALAVVLPLVIFSLSPSKLATYIAPAGAPLAILTGLMLERWLDGRHDAAPRDYKPPEVRWAMFIVVTVGAVAMYAAISYVGLHGAHALPLVVPVVAGAYMVGTWHDRTMRHGAMARLWLALIVSCAWGTVAATAYFQDAHPQRLLARAAEQVGHADFAVVTFDCTDQGLNFYYGEHVPRLDRPEALMEAARDIGPALVVFADTGDWHEAVRARPELAQRYREIAVVGTNRPLVAERTLLTPAAGGGSR